LEIPIIKHLTRAVPRSEVLFFTKKKVSSMKEADIKEMFKEASKSISISTNTVFPDPLSPTPSTCLDVKTPENI
jgi:hypothetical protein